MNLQIPAFVLQIPIIMLLNLPIIAIMIFLIAQIKKSGIPDFHSVVAGIMLFFGTVLQIAVGGAFILKLYYPTDSECVAISDTYIMFGTAASFAKTIAAGLIKTLAPKQTPVRHAIKE